MRNKGKFNSSDIPVLDTLNYMKPNKKTESAINEIEKIIKGELQGSVYNNPEEMWSDICGE